MAEEKTYVCPNCGAKTTNTENCEHCGSLLVRFVEKGIDVSGSSYFDNSLVFPGLIDEYKNNLRLQAEGKKAQTDIFWAEDDYSITVLNLRETSESKSQSTPIQLGIELDFSQYINPESPDDNDINAKSDNELMNFTQLLSFPLFTSNLYKDEEYNLLHRYYTINCGQDAEGTARILSEILIKVMGLTPFDNYRIVTYYDEDDEYYEASTYENDGQNIINNMDNTGGQNNQAKVVDSIDELKKGEEEKSRNNIAKYVCSVCGYTHEGSVPPEKCPVCLASASEFSEIQEEVVVEEAKEEVKDESVDSDNITNSELNDVVINEVNTTHEEDKSIKEEEKPCEVANLNLNKQMDSQLAPDEEEIITQYNSTHAILQVVKWYKETYNVGLKEAKDRVDEVLIKHNLWNGGKIGGGCVVTILVVITSTLSLFLLL